MKVNIWIKREEVGPQLLTLTHYYTTEPVSNLKDPDKHTTEYVQVTITTDEFVRLEDKHNNKDSGRSDQNYTYCKEWPDNSKDI